MAPRTYRINTMVKPFGIEVCVPYEDAETREQLKASGYRWQSIDKTWFGASADMALVRKQARRLTKRGYRLAVAKQGGNEPRSIATYAAWFALPLPLPIYLSDDYKAADEWGVSRSDDADIAWTIEMVGLTPEGSRDWQLTSVTLTEKGQARYDELLSVGRAAAAPAPVQS